VGASADVVGWQAVVYAGSDYAELATLACQHALDERAVTHLVLPDDVDWTAYQVKVTISADAEVEVIIDATQGILRILDGRPSTSDLCSQSGEGSHVCGFQ